MKLWRKISGSPLGKGLALLLIVSMLTNVAAPTVALALTGGPSQPEFQGFTEIGVSNMVDPFTGDFNYEIPLMTVPGPNGGYPINLTYAAGIGMEDEASWVGLGWSLNPGAINRNMRGVPDDFSGPQQDGTETPVTEAEADKITKSYFTKNNVTVGVGVGLTIPPPPPEIYGADLSFQSATASINPNVNLYYNTYKGVGFRAGIGMKLSAITSESGSSSSLAAALNLNFDSNDGASVQPSISMGAGQGRHSGAISYGFGYNSRQGITNTFLTSSYSKKYIMNGKGAQSVKSLGTGNSVSFASTTGVPSNSTPMAGFNTGFNLDFEAGFVGTHFNLPISFNGMLSVQKVKDWMEFGYAYPTYGTLYSGFRDNENIQLDRALMDYNREKDWAINSKSPMLPMPVMTHDVYSVTGAGVGGSFRAYRNDVGVFYEPREASDFLGVTIGVEVAAAAGFKVGVDPSVNFSHSYSGKWKTPEDMEQITQTNFFRKPGQLLSNRLRTVNPFDFRFTGETTAHHDGDSRFTLIGGYGPGKYTLFPAADEFPDISETEFSEPNTQPTNKFFPVEGFAKFKPKASNKMNGQPVMPENTVRKHDERKVQLVQYRTKGEIQAEVAAGGEPFLQQVIVNDPLQVMPTKTWFNLSQPEIKKHHVVEFTILQPGGMRYVYGLPLYNRKHEERYFAIEPGTPTNAKTVTVPDLTNMRKGLHNDKLFSYTSIGPYAHAHLLTQIVSPDYVDVDNNGPSADDYGYWTKFNYQAIGTYKWRTPVEANKANYIEGFTSAKHDDKATVTYGERDMTYLHSIETKTHVAVFYVSNREDARGVNGLNGGTGSGSVSKKLDRIVLYSKEDLTTPIKSVHLQYNYELCNGIKNGSSGKLTLKKIYFEYGTSTKGALTPYEFEYGKVYKDEASPSTGLAEDPALNGNPNYNMMYADRWGNYKAEENGLSNNDNPYVNQTAAAADKRLESATAWNITGMSLPTGAKIKIAYEMDDYTYVQDQVATQMYRIAGVGKSTLPDHINWLADADDKALLEREYDHVFFHLDDQSAQLEDIAAMVQQIPDGKLYFKTWQRLQVPKGLASGMDWVYDYVTGYAPIQTTSGYGIVENGPGGLKYGYVTLKPVTDDAKNWNFFCKSGIQYLRYQRADLGMPQSQGDAALEAAAMILTGIPIIIQAIELMSGYYNWAIGKNHCRYLGNGKPSYIKLGSGDGVKYGGGHRVRKITISDGWAEMTGGNTAGYGMEYFYHTTDNAGHKISSGVASYEPLIGGDENPMKKAHYYGPDNKFVHNDPAFYLEEPFGESYFPAPVVGYSKMITVNLANRKNVKTGDGIQVKEFYTAKDFPIRATYNVQPQKIEDKQTVFIPLIASISLKGYGYSQGYYIELNDMHGKPKAESLHDADYWDTSTSNWVSTTGDIPYVSKKIYKYKANGNSLDNNVEVLDGDQQIRTAVMGESSEMFSEMKEDFNYAFSAGVQINGGVDPTPYGLFATLFPMFEYNESSARILVTTKVVYKNGILDEVVEMSEGAVKKTKNLLYDPETGSPLLTAVTSDFDNAQADANNQYIYNQTYPAHWYYTGMQAAYRNYRNAYQFPGGTSTFPDAYLYFEKGDELVSVANNHKIWVNDVAGNNVYFINAAGQPATPSGTYVTVRSGKRNLQTVPTGSLASLKNPATQERQHALLNFYNTHVTGNAAYSSPMCGSGFSIPMNVTDCADPTVVYNGSLGSNCGNTQIFSGDAILFQYADGERGCFIALPVPAGFIPSKASLAYHSPTKVIVRYETAPGQITSSLVTVTSKCPIYLKGCMDGVLNATADEFSDRWTYEPEFDPAGGPMATLNRYLKGESGIWRKLRTNAYFADRKQRVTNNQPGIFNTYIGRDGTYSRYVPFDWLYDPDTQNGVVDGNKDNIQMPFGWRWQAEVTPYGYSPYGFEIENRDAMNIHSAELYGYKNSVVTASAQNAAYTEMAYDGFEETAGTYVSHGHLKLQAASGMTMSVSDDDSHTGNQSLKLNMNGGWLYLHSQIFTPPTPFSHAGTYPFQMVKNRKYLASFWYKSADTDVQPQFLLKIAGSGDICQNVMVDISSPTIEGWRRVEIVAEPYSVWDQFPSTPATATVELSFMFNNASSPVYVDDLRILPVDAPFKSYVYDPKNFLLRATLDDNNYATFYNYDEENTLIQVKKETVEGVRTIQTTRKNVKLLPTQ